MKPLILVGFLFCLSGLLGWSQVQRVDKFKQLREELPTPNEYRAANGAPGPKYWQQRANYNIQVELDDENQKIIGSETIEYFNNSPLTLTYVWVQLDPNYFHPNSIKNRTTPAPVDYNKLTLEQLTAKIKPPFPGGVQIQSVKSAAGRPLRHIIYDTMMRIDLETPLGTNQKVSFSIEWSYKINDATIEGRSGYEYFPTDKNYLYEIAQWFPRMCVFDDVNGWQHKSYIGRGEFALEFGDYRVAITVPNDHVVAATGTLMNSAQVLKPIWQERLKQAANSEKPVFIITKEEAIANESSTPTGKKTWIYEAKNVRDFAFASSRKFLWDAASVTVGGKKILAQSFYPKEGLPLWDKYSTHAIITTLKVYSRYTFDYPYPTAISVHGPVWGMEYPMICFNGGRPNPDGSYSRQLKYALISVVIHEVGHNYFPMIVSSDERQWSWLDEGLNSFLQFLTEQEFEPGYPSRRGFPQKIVPYMAGGGQEPIMTNSESINQFGNNAYGKPATALNILRETVMGRELFDYAFKEYANRWKFKHPEPADFFRTMEDASGVDLDWFWRGWFYSTDPVDIAIDNIIHFKLTNQDPLLEAKARKEEDQKANQTITKIRNDSLIQTYYISDKPELLDAYNQTDEYQPTNDAIAKYRRSVENLPAAQQEALRSGMNFYTLQFSNKGIIMPLIYQITYTDGSKELFRLPAEVWTKDNTKFNKELVTKKEIASVLIDPYLETADIDTENNQYPRELKPNRFELFKSNSR